jgi:hypothetical protein
MRFEKAALQFHAGMSVDDVSAIVGKGAWEEYSADANGKTVALTPYFFDGAWYCVYMEQNNRAGKTASSEMPCTSVKTFRLSVPPTTYLPQTQAAKDEVDPPETIRTMRWTPKGVIDVRASPLKGEDARRAAYIQDFYEQISRRTKTDLGISYTQLPQGDAKAR